MNQTSLTFADKNYNTTDYSGLGRVYLRKNIQTVVNPNTGITYSTNFLTQAMLSKENTIYIIQYDYNLNGQTITIPSGCVLLFEGGSISNGSINGVNTIIHTTSDNIFKDIIITGLWKNKEVYSSWIHSNKNEANVLFSNLINLCSNDGCTLFITGDYVGKQIKSEPNGGKIIILLNTY